MEQRTLTTRIIIARLILIKITGTKKKLYKTTYLPLNTNAATPRCRQSDRVKRHEERQVVIVLCRQLLPLDGVASCVRQENYEHKKKIMLFSSRGHRR